MYLTSLPKRLFKNCLPPEAAHHPRPTNSHFKPFLSIAKREGNAVSAYMPIEKIPRQMDAGMGRALDDKLRCKKTMSTGHEYSGRWTNSSFWMQVLKNEGSAGKLQNPLRRNVAGYKLERLLLTVLNELPMTGPRTTRAAITTMATKTRINAYSTRPCPFSLGANNMAFSSFPLDFSKVHFLRDGFIIVTALLYANLFSILSG